MGTLSEMMARQRAEAEAKKGIATNAKLPAAGTLGTSADANAAGAGVAAADRSPAPRAPVSAGRDSGSPRAGLGFLKRNSVPDSPKDGTINVTSTQTIPAQQPVDDAVESTPVVPDANTSESVPPADAPARPKLGFLKASGPAGTPAAGVKPSTSPVAGNGTADSVGAGGLARLAGLTSGANGSPVPASGGSPESESLDIPASGLSLADLDSFEGSGVVEFRPQYSDEIPATAPTRELPEDLTESQRGFIVLLNGIYSVLYDPELFGQMVRNIMSELQENPEYEKLLADEDVNAMMRGLRESMGMAKIKKAEKSKGAGRTGKAQSVKAQAVASTIDSMFDDGDFD